MFSEVLTQAAEGNTADIEKKDKELVAWFEAQGNTVNKDVDVAAMQAATAKYYDAHPKDVPWDKEVWDRLQALK